MESAPNFDQSQAMPYVPGAIPPPYSPGGAAQVAYVPGSDQPISVTLVVGKVEIISCHCEAGYVSQVQFLACQSI